MFLKVPAIDDETIDHLERLSLVNFSNQAARERLTRAVEFANQLQLVDTTGVEPMASVLEDRYLFSNLPLDLRDRTISILETTRKPDHGLTAWSKNHVSMLSASDKGHN